MKLMERIWEWLTASTSIAARKGHPDLCPLDVDRLARELNLIEQARLLGEAGIPAPGAKALTGPEAAIIQRVEKARQDYIDWAVIRLSVHNQDLGRHSGRPDGIDRAMQADKEFKREADALLTERESLVRSLGETAGKRLAALENFQAEHGLTRDAQTPRHKIFTYGVLLLMIILEGLLNAAFFAQGMSFGLVGGFAYAGVLAFINVSIAFANGKHCVCCIYHKAAGWKALGIVSLLGAVAVMGALGLGIAHLRDSLTAEAADPAAAALRTMLASPLHLRDLFSWVLFAVSCMFAVFALLDGLCSDDRYPGYGPVYRRAQKAIDAYEEEIDALRADLEKKKNDQLEILEQILATSHAAIAAFESLINDKVASGSRLSNALRDADNSMEALLRIFRTTNELHRNGAPRPAYFDVKPKLLPLRMPDFDTSADTAALDAQRETLKCLLAEVQALRACIQEAFNQQFDLLKPLDTHFPRKELV